MLLSRALCTIAKGKPPKLPSSSVGECVRQPPPGPCQPPCRPPFPRSAPGGATRVVCCPPPAGNRPPCDPPLPVCSRTCDTNAQQNQMSQSQKMALESSRVSIFERENCGEYSSRISLRKAHATRIRQQEYEAEVARGEKIDVKPIGQYRPLKKQCSALCTDGMEYKIPCPGSAARCTPPPPEQLPLTPDHGPCSKPLNNIDPCSYQRRVIIEIDRSCDAKQNKKTPAKHSSQCFNSSDHIYKHQQQSSHKLEKHSSEKKASRPLYAAVKQNIETEKRKTNSCQSLTTRLKNKFNLKSRQSGSQCARRPCTRDCEGKPQVRVGDDSWCSQPTKAKGPYCCREPTLAERLRWRSSIPKCGQERKFHTKVIKGKDTSSNTGKLAQILNERLLLKDTGRGRELHWLCEKTNPVPKNHNFVGCVEMFIPKTGNDLMRIDVYTILSKNTPIESSRIGQCTSSNESRHINNSPEDGTETIPVNKCIKGTKSSILEEKECKISKPELVTWPEKRKSIVEVTKNLITKKKDQSEIKRSSSECTKSSVMSICSPKSKTLFNTKPAQNVTKTEEVRKPHASKADSKTISPKGSKPSIMSICAAKPKISSETSNLLHKENNNVNSNCPTVKMQHNKNSPEVTNNNSLMSNCSEKRKPSMKPVQLKNVNEIPTLPRCEKKETKETGSWLSIKELKRKISSNKKEENIKTDKNSCDPNKPRRYFSTNAML